MKQVLKKHAMSITLFCCALVFVSCSDKYEPEQISSNNEKIISEGCIPFDYIGEQHNAFLYAIGLEYKDTMNLYAELARKNMLDAEMQEHLAQKIINGLPMIEKKYKIFDVSDNMMNEYLETGVAYLNMDSADNLFFDNELGDVVVHILENLETSPNLNIQRDIIRAKELELLKHATCSLDTCVVITLNVLEHSMMFWNDAYENGNNPWHNYLSATDSLILNVTFNTKSNFLQGIGRFFARIKDKAVEAFKNIIKPNSSKIAKLAVVDAVMTGATLYGLAHSPLAANPGAVVGGALVSGVLTSVGCGILNWRTL